MTAFIGTLIFFVGLLMLYALVIRPWLKKQSWAQGWFSWIEPLEIALFKKSETVLAGRLVWLSSFVVAAYDGIAAFATQLDLTPLQTRIFDALHIPSDMQGLATSVALMGVGLAMVKLRKTTTKPLELVSIPDSSVTPQVAQALDVAEVTKNDAVAAVNEAKAV